MPYVYSTLTCNTKYTDYEKNYNLNVKKNETSVLIKGGANLPTAGLRSIITPKGVATEVTDKQLEFLENNYHFKQHVEKGFITVDKAKVKPEKVAKDMSAKDNSAPKVLKDLEATKTKEFKLD